MFEVGIRACGIIRVMKEAITFTSADIFWESTLRFLKSGNPVLVLQIIVKGMEYNQAQQSKGADRIAQAYDNLPIDLKDFKHNFLSRPTNTYKNGGHWGWLPWEN